MNCTKQFLGLEGPDVGAFKRDVLACGMTAETVYGRARARACVRVCARVSMSVCACACGRKCVCLAGRQGERAFLCVLVTR